MSETYDVAVVGGGPAGFAAAVAAGRMGMDVLLVETAELLGGSATTGLVNNFCNAYWDDERFIIGGIFGEFRHRLQGRKSMWTTRGPNTEEKLGQEFFDPDAYADEMARMCRQASVEIRLETACTGADFDADPTQLAVGDDTVRAERVVDATGDAVLAHRSGVPTEIGRGRGEIQPLTYCYMFGPVDLDALAEAHPEAMQYDENVGTRYAAPSYVDEISDMVRRDIEAGALDLGVSTLYGTMSVPGQPEHMTTNFGHVEVEDPTDPEAMERATEEGKRQMREGLRWFRENLPGFEDVDVVREPGAIGVRESRQIVGEYTLDADDLASRRQFDDVIAQCCFNVDVHTAGTDHDHSGGSDVDGLERAEHYDIPWRTLVPSDGPAGLVVAGRSISATSVAMSSFRVSPSVMAIGEAAGVTAALAAAEDIGIADVDAGDVQGRLKRTGAILT